MHIQQPNPHLIAKRSKDVFEKYRFHAITLKVGCQIIFTRNVYDITNANSLASFKLSRTDLQRKIVDVVEVCNGTRAQVLEIYPNEGILITFGSGTLFFPLARYTILLTSTRTPSDLCSRDRPFVEESRFASARFLPCVLGYGLTIHRSQGISLDQAVISLPYIRDFALAYVAVSRVRTKNGLFLKEFNFSACPIDPLIEQFISGKLHTAPFGLTKYLALPTAEVTKASLKRSIPTFKRKPKKVKKSKT